MTSERERKRRVKAKLNTQLNAKFNAGRDYGFARGKAEGKAEAAKEHAETLRAKEREANLKYAEALSKLMNSVCQASCAFFGEGGLRP